MMNDEPRPIMSAEQFGAYLERRLVLNDDVVEVRERRGMSLMLRVGDRNATIDVTPFYQAYAANPDQLDAVAQTLVSALTHDMPRRDERDFAALSDRIFPMFKPVELLLTVRERRLPMLVYREFLADLIITYVIDEARSVAYLNEDHIERWGVSAQEIHEAAMQNLRRRTDERVRYTSVGEGEQRLFILNSGDGYDATRLLLTDILAEWARMVRGRLVVGIPNRDFLIALGDSNQDILQNVAAQIQADATQREHTLTDRLFTLVGGQIREYEME